MVSTLENLAIRNIQNNTEFQLLTIYYKELFKKNRLDIKYINYALDCYNLNKHLGKFKSLKYSLVETMETMIDDYAYSKAVKSGDY